MVEKAVIQAEEYKKPAPIPLLRVERSSKFQDIKEVEVSDPSLFFSNPVVNKFDI